MKKQTKKASKSGAKKKPMRVWVVVNPLWTPREVHQTCTEARYACEYWEKLTSDSYRVVEFREHRPARKARNS